MPGKSRHAKGKHQYNSKKSRTKQRQAATATPPPAIAGISTPFATVSTPSSKVPTTPPVARVAQYRYVTAELVRIGILSGAILIILVVLALVLS